MRTLIFVNALILACSIALLVTSNLVWPTTNGQLWSLWLALILSGSVLGWALADN